MRYILNSAVLTAFGSYSYDAMDREGAQYWLSRGHYQSTIVYLETAEALSALLGVPIVADRRTITMAAGDEALVFRLALPPGSAGINPSDKGQILRHVQRGHWELGLLRRTD